MNEVIKEGLVHLEKARMSTIQTCQSCRCSSVRTLKSLITLNSVRLSFHRTSLRSVTEVIHFTHWCCLLCLPARWYSAGPPAAGTATPIFPTSASPDRLAPVSISVPATGSALSLSSVSFIRVSVKLSSPLRASRAIWAAPTGTLAISRGAWENVFRRSLLAQNSASVCVSVLQRAGVHCCSPLVVCCGCKFAASSASVWSTIKSGQINRLEGGRRLEVSGQCSLESSVHSAIRCGLLSLFLSVPQMSPTTTKKDNRQSPLWMALCFQFLMFFKDEERKKRWPAK